MRFDYPKTVIKSLVGFFGDLPTSKSDRTLTGDGFEEFRERIKALDDDNRSCREVIGNICYALDYGGYLKVSRNMVVDLMFPDKEDGQNFKSPFQTGRALYDVLEIFDEIYASQCQAQSELAR